MYNLVFNLHNTLYNLNIFSMKSSKSGYLQFDFCSSLQATISLIHTFKLLPWLCYAINSASSALLLQSLPHPSQGFPPFSLIFPQALINLSSSHSLMLLQSTPCTLLTRPSTSPFQRSLAVSTMPARAILAAGGGGSGLGSTILVKIRDCCWRRAAC
jgi:hypothetical protein